ncbi:hypothetical protein GEMRC1_003912 [Eukaryota sp. GEM-RC1]
MTTSYISLLNVDLQYLGRSEDEEIEEANLIRIPSHRRINNFGVIFTIVKCYTSAGCLTIPHGLSNAGILAIVFFPVVLLLNLYSMLLLVRCRRELEEAGASFSKLATLAVCRPFGLLVNVCSKCFQSTVIVTHMILIASFLEACSFVPHLSTSQWLGFLLLPILLLCLIRQFKGAAWVAFAASICLLFAILIVSSRSLTIILSDGISPSLTLFDTPGAISFFGQLIYLLEGRSLTLPTFNSMKHQSQFDRILVFSLLSLLIIFSVFSIIICMAFGTQISDQPFTQLLKNPLFLNTSSILVCISMLISLFIMSIPLFQSLEFNIRNRYRKFQKWVFGHHV